MAKMKNRAVNAYDVIQGWMKSRPADCSFEGESRADFEAWRDKFRRHYRKCLGPWPAKTDPRVEVIERADKSEHIREKIVFDSSPGVSAPAWLLTPKGIAKDEKRPALLAAHGHGKGKDEIVGYTREHGDKAAIERLDNLNYEYALEGVKRGYVVIAPDWLPFGERRPPEEWIRGNRDACNITDLAWQYFGAPLITQNVWDAMRAIDVLTARKEVDRRRVGVIGLSYGGTMATHILINDRRVKAGVVSGYISRVRGDALDMRGRGNTCGAQHVPNLLRHGDIADMLGLAAPKPILFETGRRETCFHFPDMDHAYRHLRRIYKAAGSPNNIARDIHPNDHMWSGAKAWDWLAKWL